MRPFERLAEKTERYDWTNYYCLAPKARNLLPSSALLKIDY